MKLLCKSNIHKTRESTPSKLRPESIVDRIKNSLSPAPKRHSLRNIEIEKEKPNEAQKVDINERIRSRERSVARGVSQMRDNLARDFWTSLQYGVWKRIPSKEFRVVASIPLLCALVLYLA